MTPSYLPVIRDFKQVTNGVTYRKMGPWHDCEIGTDTWRWDALVMKDGHVSHQFATQSNSPKFELFHLRELHHAAWQAFNGHFIGREGI
jgi:hypothetical protein